ncbi:MAG TPA: ATPase domain-containing protein [Longimicrobiales bacterium]|nr:ATPase domain-containing protein [Longimicrobiales bacterium]
MRPMGANGKGRIRIRTGIAPLDERTGGLDSGGLYLIIGPPGPAKMVAGLQFLNAGVRAGERVALLSSGDAAGTLQVAEAWGFPMREPWRSGQLRLVGFREEFELRALRSVAPDEVLAELQELLSDDVTRIAVDPGSLFLTGPGRTTLGSTFLSWGRRQRATVCATFSLDVRAPAMVPPDWVGPFLTGAVAVEARGGNLHQVTLLPSVPEPGFNPESITVELEPGAGLVRPRSFPTRRREDRPSVDPDRLLLISLGGEHPGDLGVWAQGAFRADIVSEPYDALARLQPGSDYGSVLVHAPRLRVREAIQACRAIRPLTKAGMVFASDDGVRSNDRIAFLEAGCDDTLTGGLDFRELELRLRPAAARGGQIGDHDVREAMGEREPARRGGRVAVAILTAEIRRRRSRNGDGLFSLLRLTSDREESLDNLEPHLLREIRSEDGDMVTRAGCALLVLLSGARESQTEAFLRRFRSSLRGQLSSPSFQVRVASHPSNTNEVEAMLEGLGAGRA